MGVKISEMTADSAIGGSEKIPVLDGSNNYTITTDQMAAYAIDELISATAATATTGDYLLGYRSTDEKSFTLNGVSTYAVDYVFGVVTEADPAVSGDMLLVDRSGTQYKVDVDTLKTYVRTTIQADTLGTYVNGLTTATLGATDDFLVSQSGTCKNATLSELETKLWTDYATYVAALDAVVTAADANVIYALQSGAPKKLALSTLATYIEAEIDTTGTLSTSILGDLAAYVAALDPVTTVASTDKFYTIQSATEKYVTAEDIAAYAVAEAGELPWVEVTTSKYTATPASTSTITMTDTSDFAVGYPVKYTYGGSTYYGIVTAVSANALLTIAGPTLDAGTDLDALYVGRPERVVVEQIQVNTAAFAAVQDVSSITKEYRRWEKADAYLATFSATLGVADTGASQPKINVKVAGNAVSTNDTNNGIQLSATPGTWTSNSAVAVLDTAYDIVRGDAIDIRCTAAGTNGDADCLSVNLVFVLE